MFTSDMIPKLKNISTNSAIKGTIIVSVGIFLGSIFSYLLQIRLGYLLTIEDFGTFNAFLSLTTICGIPSAAVSVALIKKVSELLAQNDFHTLKRLFWSFTKLSLLTGILLAGILVVFSKPIAGYLNILDIRLILVFALFLAFSYLNLSPVSYLQGLLRFKAFSFFSFVSQLLRLTIPLLLVYLGFGVSGVYFGFIIVVFLSFLISVVLLNKNLRMGVRPQSKTIEMKLDFLYKQILIFSIPVLLINSGVSLLNNIDIILVKHLFSPLDAGIYAGVVTMGKVFLFGAGLVQVVMFPQISHLYASKGDYIGRFRMFLILQVVLISGGVFIYILFPTWINLLMFGGKFVASVNYLPLFALFMAFYVLLNFLSMFLLAINKTKAYLVILPSCLLQYLSINLIHTGLSDIIRINILVSAVACFLTSIYVVKSIYYSSPNAENGKIAL
jgi:O-antigen/teichoic acid export membrane protein